MKSTQRNKEIILHFQDKGINMLFGQMTLSLHAADASSKLVWLPEGIVDAFEPPSRKRLLRAWPGWCPGARGSLYAFEGSKGAGSGGVSSRCTKEELGESRPRKETVRGGGGGERKRKEAKGKRRNLWIEKRDARSKQKKRRGRERERDRNNKTYTSISDNGVRGSLSPFYREYKKERNDFSGLHLALEILSIYFLGEKAEATTFNGQVGCCWCLGPNGVWFHFWGDGWFLGILSLRWLFYS